MDWLPTLSDWHGPVFLRIVDALSADIASGRLARGQKLPTHRYLATKLGIDLTTVTRAYSEARRRGLLAARVGRGTFVSETTTRDARHVASPVSIDLSMNLPPQPLEANLDLRIAQGLEAVRLESGFSSILSYSTPGGSSDQREVAATWLKPRIPGATNERIVIYPGTQSIIFNSLRALTSPGDVVATETLTFPGLKAAAARLGVLLIGIDMDSEGAVPDSLNDICRKHNPRAVYLVPTQQNPTTRTMGLGRRRAIANVLRKHQTPLIEDDAYGAIETSASPIVNLIPNQTYYAASVSKCIAPALRVSYLLAPNDIAVQTLRSELQATVQMPPSLMVALLTYWIRSGVADEIIRAIRNEAEGRQQLATRLLKGVSYEARRNSHHLWMPLSVSGANSAIQERLLNNGLAVVSEKAFAVDNSPAPGLRISLGAARTRAELAQALNVVASVMKAPHDDKQVI